jgi:GT2 family glycosyltransferase
MASDVGMSSGGVLVAIPSLRGGRMLRHCLLSVLRQTHPPARVVVIDNSGAGLVKESCASLPVEVLSMPYNVGFGAAVNAAARSGSEPFIATLNDDALASESWLEESLKAILQDVRIGMCAPQIRLTNGLLDSAGLLLACDGTAKQRGHRQPPETHSEADEVLCPSGAAALYRRSMLEQVGYFDESFFLYCEDLDLGLRARWAGWKCVYVPQAVIEHRYSASAGRASALKAYLVERNRIYTVMKNFPPRALACALISAWLRYAWHLVAVLRKQGLTGEFARQQSPFRLPWLVAKAHAVALGRLPQLWRARRSVVRSISTPAFVSLLHRHRIPLREVARL